MAHRSFRRVDFGNTAFLDEAVFDNRDILEPSSFRDCIFMKRASFHGSRLHQGVSFHGAAFDASLDPGSQFKEGAKRRPVFALADHVLKRLREADVAHRAAKGEPAISFKDWLLAFEAKRTAAGERFRALPQKTVDAETGASKDRYFADLEDAFRTLKRAMEENRNRSEEGRFFKLELLARRQRRDKEVPEWERLLSYPYEWVSDFGNSVVRPFIGLLAIILIFRILYAVIATLQVRWPTGPEWGEAMIYSAGRVVPFGPWAGDPEPCTVMGRLLDVAPSTEDMNSNPACKSDLANVNGPWVAFGVGFIASLQSFFAIILAFLAALAARRRFQIN